jgi:chemotaxis protein MotB
MNRLISSIPIASVMILLVSCGASKELKMSNEKLAAENAQLQTNLSATEKKLADAQTQNTSLNAQISNLAGEAKMCIEAKESLQKNLQAMNGRLAEQGTSLKQLKEKAEADLDKLEALGAQVQYNHGRVHITVPDDYVFKSGSATIGAKGAEALKVIADILNDFPNLETVVVGNTDNVPVKSAVFKDNWSLSTERANAVVRLLVNSYGVNPNRMIAAGRSEYNPISANELVDGRAMNRRIEFVLSPNLSKLWEVKVE